MALEPHYRDQIIDRVLLVVDDFVTEGHSFEWARNALLEAKAERVISVGIGKYGQSYDVRTVKKGVVWDVFAASTLTDIVFDSVAHTMTIEPRALEEFVDSYKRFNSSVR